MSCKEQFVYGVVLSLLSAFALGMPMGCAKVPECIAGAERRCPDCPAIRTQVCEGDPAVWSYCGCPQSSAGQSCENQADCGEGERCERSVDQNLLGGGAPGGWCILDCTNDLEACPTGTRCVQTNGPDQSLARCLEVCQLGLGGCDNDLVCTGDIAALGCNGANCAATPGEGLCRPFCARDSDCGGSLRCDRKSGLCTSDDETPGGPLGAACTSDSDCEGECYQEGEAAFCTHSCRQLPPGLEAAVCETTSSGNDELIARGYCGLSAAAGYGFGDEGLCAPVCTQDDDCPAAMSCDLTFNTTVEDTGICVVGGTRTTDEPTASTEAGVSEGDAEAPQAVATGAVTAASTSAPASRTPTDAGRPQDAQVRLDASVTR